MKHNILKFGDAAKALLKGKFIALNINIKKEESSQTKNLTSTLKNNK